MSIYFAPALISLLFKLFVLAYVLRGGKVSVIFLSLIVVFAIHNAIEFVGHFYLQNDESIETLFRLYYVATIYVVLYILLHSLTISKLDNNILVYSFVAISTGLASLVLFTDQVIAGLYSIGYTVSATKGGHFWTFATYILITLSGSLYASIHGYRRAESQMDSVRSLHSLMALAPLILVCALAMAFKILNIGVNATGLIPIATAIFLMIILKTESKHKLSDLRRLMPLSPERATTNNLMDLLDNYIKNSGQHNVYKELQEGIEKEIILYSIDKCEGNISNTTKMMGLKNRSTLYSMLNRLEIDVRGRKADIND